MNKINVYISSCTGNTKKLANGLLAELNQRSQPILVHENSLTPSIVNQDDLIIVCFWCRKSTLDAHSKAIIDSFEGKRILAFGTMGGYPNSEYGEKVETNVTSYINKKTTVWLFISVKDVFRLSAQNIESIYRPLHHII